MQLNTLSLPRFGQQAAQSALPVSQESRSKQSNPLTQPAADTVKFGGVFDVDEPGLENTLANRREQAKNLVEVFPFDKWVDVQDVAAKAEAIENGENPEAYPSLKEMMTPEKMAQFKSNLKNLLGEGGDFSAQDLKEWVEASVSENPEKVEKAFQMMVAVGMWCLPFDESDFGT